MLKKRYFKTKDECEVTFELTLEDIVEAVVVCDVNGWEPIAMKKTRKGPFQAKVRFPKDGSFQFRYVVDSDRWINDDQADRYETNEYGTENSVLSTVAD